MKTMKKQFLFFNLSFGAGYIPALFWLLFCVATVWWCGRVELQANREQVGQRLNLIARADVVRLENYLQRLLGVAQDLASDPLFATAVERFFNDVREEEPVRARLGTLGRLGPYRDILLYDGGGRLRLTLADAGIPVGGVTEARFLHHDPAAAPLVQMVDQGLPGAKPIIGVSTAIISADRHRDRVLARFVLLAPLPNLVQDVHDRPADASPFLVMAQGHRFPLANAVADAMGDIPLGDKPVSARLPVAGSDWSILVVQSIAPPLTPWKFRGTILLILVWAVGGGLLYFHQRHSSLHRRQQAWSCAALEQIRRRQHALFFGAREAMVLVDGKQRIVALNPQACLLTGWEGDQAMGRPLAEILPLVDGKKLTLCNLQPGTAAGEECTSVLRTKDGQDLRLSLRVVPCGEDDADEKEWLLAFSDRSSASYPRDLVESRLLLREYAYTHGVHELLHRAMQELATLVKSPRGLCCSADAPFCAVAVEQSVATGQADTWSWYDAQGEPICSRLHELSSEVTVVESEETAQAGGTAPQVDCRFGQVREIILPLYRAGNLVAVMVLADKSRPYSPADVDTVTRLGDYIWRLVEQKQMEEALLASERRYRTLYRSMMDAFVVTDLSGRIRECNLAYADMLGFSPEELKGKLARDFTPATWLEYEQEHVRKQLMHGGCSELYEKEYRHRDGRVFPVELRTYLLVNNEGQPEGMSAVVRDISRRKQADEEREKLRDRLNLAQKLESVGQLAGGVAHDFNNMLSVIIGFAELALRRMEVPEPLDMYLREIVTAAKRSADVTRQLLAFARQQRVVPKVLELNPTVEGMLKMLYRLIGEDVELIWLPGEDLWPLKMDPSQIDQLLANLCVNARDAIGGVGKITIETDRVSFDEAYCAERGGFLPGDFVVLAVSDNGCGIDRALQDKIFEPFFTTKAVGQGTGLGLATVYGIVKQNRGFINVYSEPGQGTTFRIYLPRQQGESGQKHVADLQSIPIGQGELILVVEDEPAMLSLNQTLLEQLNYRVLTASKPGKALMVAREYGAAIDLVIIDVIMPEMNGRDLAGKIVEICPKAEILFVSGYTASVIAHQGELEETTAFLTKPFSTSELAWKVREVLLD